MSKIIWKTVGELFDIVRGNSKYKRDYEKTNRGKYPVFSAALNKPLININTFDFDGEYLSWTINGYGGYFLILKGKFSVNADRGILIPKHKNLDLEYFRFTMQPICRELAIGRKLKNNKNEYTKLHPYIISSAKIPVPIKKNGDFDLEAQKKLILYYKKIEAIKDKIRFYKEEIENTNLPSNTLIYDKTNFVNIKLDKIFDVKNGKAKYTKDYIKVNYGNIPVYSSKTKDDGVLGHINSFDHDVECIQVTTNGAKAGTLFYRKKHKFNINGDAKLLIKKESNIDYEYIYYALKKVFIENGFNWGNKVSNTKLRNISVEVPIKIDGEYDVNKQKELAHNYELNNIQQNCLIKIKGHIISELSDLINVQLIISHN